VDRNHHLHTAPEQTRTGYSRAARRGSNRRDALRPPDGSLIHGYVFVFYVIRHSRGAAAARQGVEGGLLAHEFGVCSYMIYYISGKVGQQCEAARYLRAPVLLRRYQRQQSSETNMSVSSKSATLGLLASGVKHCSRKVCRASSAPLPTSMRMWSYCKHAI
jgi:hypothetical protein